MSCQTDSKARRSEPYSLAIYVRAFRKRSTSWPGPGNRVRNDSVRHTCSMLQRGCYRHIRHETHRRNLLLQVRLLRVLLVLVALLLPLLPD